MRKSLFLLLLLAMVSGLHAQDKSAKPKVMIIPFDPDMYFSDADQDLAKYNNKNVKEVRTTMRAGLNTNINAKVLADYETRPLLNDTANDAAKDLYAIYKSINYFKDKTKPDEHDPTRNKDGSIKKQFAKKDPNTSKLFEVDKDGLRIYINVKVYDVKMLDYLHKKYGTEIFLFVNQFNLVTDFAQVIDENTNSVKRELGVHYSIFDYTGKQLAGDIATVTIPSSIHNMDAVMKASFPTLADRINRDLPGHVKMVPETEDSVNKNKEKKQ